VSREIEQAVDEILANQRTRRSTPNPPIPVKVNVPLPRILGLKRRIRAAIRESIVEYGSVAFDDEVNSLTNRLYKGLVRPSLARAWKDGAEAGSEAVSACCGCSGGELPPNPYES
jgi:hypothetical protein